MPWGKHRATIARQISICGSLGNWVFNQTPPIHSIRQRRSSSGKSSSHRRPQPSENHNRHIFHSQDSALLSHYSRRPAQIANNSGLTSNLSQGCLSSRSNKSCSRGRKRIRATFPGEAKLNHARCKRYALQFLIGRSLQRGPRQQVPQGVNNNCGVCCEPRMIQRDQDCAMRGMRANAQVWTSRDASFPGKRFNQHQPAPCAEAIRTTTT